MVRVTFSCPEVCRGEQPGLHAGVLPPEPLHPKFGGRISGAFGSDNGDRMTRATVLRLASPLFAPLFMWSRQVYCPPIHFLTCERSFGQLDQLRTTENLSALAVRFADDNLVFGKFNRASEAVAEAVFSN